MARSHALKKGYVTGKKRILITQKNYKVGVLKTTVRNFKFIEKSFIDYTRGNHLDIIIITVADYKDIFLSVKPNIGLSAIEILTTKYGKDVVKGDELLAQTTSHEVLLEESKELMYFIASNY